MIKKIVILSVFLTLSLAPGAAAAPAKDPKKADSCTTCHKDEKFRVQNKKIYDYYQEWKGSPHDLAGMSCTACHGGDPEKSIKEEAHQGILPQSDPKSPFHFSNIPKTCGSCHPEVLARFEKSRHFEQLKATGRGPSCITCHGALDAKVYHTTIVDRACANCHNKKMGINPAVVGQAKEILGRLSHADGYRKGLRFYYKSINDPKAMVKVDAAYDDVIRYWHEFDFKRLGPRTKDLLAELKALYVAAHEKDKK